MSKSQARKKPAGQPPTTAPRPWGWFAAGFFLGAFSLFLLLLSGIAPDPRLTMPAGNEQLAASQAKPATRIEKPQQFEFYTRLQENQVVPPKVPEYDPGTAREDVRYLLQAASFRRYEDADELRARLALLGIETAIQQVDGSSSESWYRVQAGPYVSKRKVSVVRKKMRDAKLDPLVLQIKP